METNVKNQKVKLIADALQVASAFTSDEEALVNLRQFDDKYSKFSNEDFIFANCAEIKQESFVGKPITLICSISEYTEPRVFNLAQPGASKERTTIINATLRDKHGIEIQTVAMTFESILPLINPDKSKQLFFQLKGTVVSISERFRNGYFFFIKEICQKITQLDLLKLDKKSRIDVAMLVKKLTKTPDGLRLFLKQELVSMYNIKGLESAEQLDKAIDFVIIQAFSSGMSAQGIYSNKLHSLIIGAPASGKKLITKCALALSPNGKHISSTNSKITPAGLIGNAKKGTGGYHSTPGLIPSANDGVICIEDFHEIAKRRNEISSILSAVMEDGKIEDSTSAKTTHIACTSINIDMNRLSQVDHMGRYNSYTDLNIPINIISRFDFIIDIPPDVERQMKVSLDMVGRFSNLVSEEPSFKESDREKQLKKIVAYVNTNYRSVNVSQKVNNYIKKKLSIIYEANEKYSNIKKHLGSMLTRLQISIEKFSKAIATSKLKHKMTIEDVDEAFNFISHKLEFLSSIGFLDNQLGQDEKISEKDLRKEIILKQFQNQDFTIKQIIDCINEAGKTKVEERTIRRDVDELIKGGVIKKVRHGLYKIEG